jgi:cytochrome c biogenesis protein CcmG, thiol:disulfide interchange protein DsbE
MNQNTRNILISVVLGALLVGFGVSLLRPSEPGNKSTALLEEKSAPTFALETLDGGQLRLEQFKGKPVVLNFFASWCVPCKDEAPMLAQAALEYAPKGVVFLGIAYNDKKDKAREFRDQFNLGFPVMMDDNADSGRTSVKYALFGVPETFFIDKDGVIRKHYPKPIVREELEAGLKLIGAL